MSQIVATFMAGRRNDLPVHYFFGHLRQRAVVAEPVGPQPDQGVAHAYPELNGDHPGGLVHDVMEVGAGPQSGGELAGPGSLPCMTRTACAAIPP